MASIVVGVLSFMFHASYTAVFQFGDFFGMYVFGVIPLTFNMRRLGYLPAKWQITVASATVVVLCGFTVLGMLFKFYYQFLVALVILIDLALESWLYFRHRHDAPGKRPSLFHFFVFLGESITTHQSQLFASNIWCRDVFLLSIRPRQVRHHEPTVSIPPWTDAGP